MKPALDTIVMANNVGSVKQAGGTAVIDLPKVAELEALVKKLEARIKALEDA